MGTDKIIKLVVMLIEAYGRENGIKGAEKLEKAIRVIRQIDKTLVDSDVKLTEVITGIETAVAYFQGNGWSILSKVGGDAVDIAARVRQSLAVVRTRLEWLSERVDSSGIDIDSIIGGD